MTSPSGSFRSHKAAVSAMDPRSQYCSWLITLAETYNVSLSFKELTIPSCKDTFLRIYDGSNNTAPLLGTYCGSNASTEIVVSSSTNSLYIVSNCGIYGRNRKNTFTFHAQYNVENSIVKEKTDSRIIIIATTVGGFVFLCIVLIVFLIKYKRQKRARKLLTPVNIPLADATPQQSLPIDQEPHYETVLCIKQEYDDDVATKANESEDISAEGRTSDHEEVGNTTENERGESYEYMNMGMNLPDYEEPDVSKRGVDHYQKLVKT
ncbi:Hypothetical predicted protein [Paramuricea clavata]|uniref:Uncharacterized protein n=1 Tax=Paramuricea clavata TaxID=317549 RepID=A0A6S7HTP6_PARCT|nr:Hypothetical predicted protein [Paramuricea clavata]